jgi:hypothetical protein
MQGRVKDSLFKVPLPIQNPVMTGLKFGTNTAIFLLFFGVAVIEAVQTQNWLKVVFWVAISLVFLLADILKKK